MLILLSCAKTMADTSSVQTPFVTTPRFEGVATEIALQLSQVGVEELGRLLRVNPKIAAENCHRFQLFFDEETRRLPALLAYTGIVFKRLHPADFTADDFAYAQQHLRLTSFCYGLLRPLDCIRLYRLEGDVRLPDSGETLFAFWRRRLTDLFLAEIEGAGGHLCYLASDEMRHLFDWVRLEQAVRIVTPEFRVWKNGKWSTVVVYTKMARGEMARFILKNRVIDLEQLKHFSWEGFEFNEALSDEKRFVFVNGAMG